MRASCAPAHAAACGVTSPLTLPSRSNRRLPEAVGRYEAPAGSASVHIQGGWIAKAARDSDLKRTDVLLYMGIDHKPRIYKWPLAKIAPLWITRRAHGANREIGVPAAATQMSKGRC